VLHVKPQAPAVQEAEALLTLVVHFLPHDPQLFGSVDSLTHAPLQLESPEGQPLTHAEFEQSGVPPLQACPHEPQLLVLLVVSMQAPPHSVYPLLQVKPHVPLEHVAVALATVVEHLLPQEWQFCVSLCSSTQLAPQRFCPAGQPETHCAGPPPSSPPSAAAAEQTGVPASAVHAYPQKPQLAVVLSWTHVLPQSVYPALHEVVHMLLTQAACPFGSDVVQATPPSVPAPPSAPAHPPQLVVVLVVSTHAPLQTTWLPVQPETHAYVSPVLGIEQTGVPPSQLIPHDPQLSAVVSVTQAPSHKVYPVPHPKEHTPTAQVAIWFAPLVLHARPHPLQLFGSVAVSTQVPEHTVDELPGQVAMHANVWPEAAQRGVDPLQVVPHAPQFDVVLGSTQPPMHGIWTPGQPPSSAETGASAGGGEPSVRGPPSPWDEVVASVHLSPLHLSLYALSPEMEAHAPTASAAAPPAANPMSHRTLLRMRLFARRSNQEAMAPRLAASTLGPLSPFSSFAPTRRDAPRVPAGG
jgi:hypothetical protein